ncbi:hypothetical protein ACIHEJ_38190 [Streptomyces sp. NPDC052301]|uniref:hypothetical protein n=1 Tax=Streptomyces sp. NPDC052301 TaxID=3365687 RepID=UPI0037D418A6
MAAGALFQETWKILGHDLDAPDDTDEVRSCVRLLADHVRGAGSSGDPVGRHAAGDRAAGLGGETRMTSVSSASTAARSLALQAATGWQGKPSAVERAGSRAVACEAQA